MCFKPEEVGGCEQCEQGYEEHVDVFYQMINYVSLDNVVQFYIYKLGGITWRS